MKSRIEARKLISYEVGDGNNIFLWHNKWHPNGVLLEEYGHRIIYDATSTFNAKVSSVLRNKEWVWRPARSENLVEIQSKLSQIQIMDYDRAIWSISASGNFSCAATWEHFRTKGEEVNWWKLIWFKEAIPKHSFIGWLVIRNRLSKKASLMEWVLGGDSACLYCRQSIENRDHLFFKCSFTSRIWKQIMALCLVSNTPDDWHSILRWGIVNLKGKSFRASICKVAWWATVYHV